MQDNTQVIRGVLWENINRLLQYCAKKNSPHVLTDFLSMI